MEGLIVMLVIVASLVVLGLLALTFGVDSRPSYTDDWSR
jgi:hypothetical protein